MSEQRDRALVIRLPRIRMNQLMQFRRGRHGVQQQDQPNQQAAQRQPAPLGQRFSQMRQSVEKLAQDPTGASPVFGKQPDDHDHREKNFGREEQLPRPPNPAARQSCVRTTAPHCPTRHGYPLAQKNAAIEWLWTRETQAAHITGSMFSQAVAFGEARLAWGGQALPGEVQALRIAGVGHGMV
jgi:hypothetical protein